MNVNQLIKRLKKYDKSLMVVISGYEGGENEIEKLELIDIELNRNTEGYYGKHQDVTYVEQRGGVVIKALKIS